MSKKPINKSSRIVVLSGGFEPEKYSAATTGRAIFKALTNAGYKNCTVLNINTNLVKNIQTIKPDFAFISVFCKWGEDGILQGLLETLDIPYSGCGVEASALCNNKFFFNQFVKSLEILSPKTILCLTKEEALKSINKIGFPCIVKPAYQGYSMGISLVLGQELEKAISEAFLFSSKIILQEYIEGKEYTVGVIDYPKKGTMVLPITEFPLVHQINNVYMKDNDKGEALIPANLTYNQSKKLTDQVMTIYKSIGCSGLSRFDVRIRGEDIYFLENNTFPGLSNYSYLTHQLKAANITLENLVEYLMISGISRKPLKIDYSFS